MPTRIGRNIGSISHPGSTGVGPTQQGTLGGTAQGRAQGARPGRVAIPIGDEGYLWILIALELLATAALRRYFRRHHGG